MKSEERWYFAQRFSALTMLKSGLVLAITSVLGLFFSFSELGDKIIGYAIIFATAIFLFVRTERALKKFP